MSKLLKEARLLRNAGTEGLSGKILPKGVAALAPLVLTTACGYGAEQQAGASDGDYIATAEAIYKDADGKYERARQLYDEISTLNAPSAETPTPAATEVSETPTPAAAEAVTEVATEESETPTPVAAEAVTEVATPVATEESVKPMESIEVSSVTITGVPLEGVSPTRYAGIIQPEQTSTIFPEGGFFFAEPGVITTNDKDVLENSRSAVDNHAATSTLENRFSEVLLKQGGYNYFAMMGGRIHVPGFGVDGQGITIDLQPEEGTGYILYLRGPFAEENRGSVTTTVDTPVGGSAQHKDITPADWRYAGFISDEQARDEAMNMAGGLRENAENCSGVEGCQKVIVVAVDVNRGEVGIWETTAENPGVMKLLWTNVVEPSVKN